MKKYVRIFLLLVLVVGLISSSSCMRSYSFTPDGLEELIENFYVLPVRVRSSSYTHIRNILHIMLEINSDYVNESEDILKLLDVISEYFRSEQFTHFMENRREGIDIDTLEVDLHIIDYKRERSALFFQFNAINNFEVGIFDNEWHLYYIERWI